MSLRILLETYIPNFRSNCVPNENDFRSFLLSILKNITESSSNVIELGMISKLIEYVEQYYNKNMVFYIKLTELILLSEPSGDGIRSIFEGRNRFIFLDPCALAVEMKILSAFTLLIKNEEISCVNLQGKQTDFLEFTSAGLFIYPRTHTLTLWILVNKWNILDNIILFRMKHKEMTIESILSDQMPDESRTLTLRIFTSSPQNPGLVKQYELKSYIKLSVGRWHFLTFKHSCHNSYFSASVLIDGRIILEQNINFQVNHYPGINPSVWAFGSGLCGKIANICLYADDVPPSMIQLLFDAGPKVSLPFTSVTCPQSSFDTGYSKLSTRLMKGSQCSPIFYVTPSHFQDNSLPLCPYGKLSIDQLEISSFNQSQSPTSKVLHLRGECVVSLQPSWSKAWMQAGGVLLVLHNLSHLADIVGRETTRKSVIVDDNLMVSVRECVYLIIRLLGSLIKSSVDLREDFLQHHGFHVVSHCLRALRRSQLAALDHMTVTVCLELVLSLGVDALEGDGIAAALQGLLFDFSLWGETSKSTQEFLLARMADYLSEHAACLYHNIGVQRILDVLRLHVLRAGGAGGSHHHHQSPLTAPPPPSPVSPEDELSHCADTGHRLLCVAMDAALEIHQKSTSPRFIEAEMLLSCLEETGSVLLAERLLRSLLHLKFVAPKALKQVLLPMRFADVTALQLLTRPGQSTEVRRSALILLLWYLSEDILKIPDQLVKIRDKFSTSVAPLHHQGRLIGNNSNSSGSGSGRKHMAPAAVNDIDMKRAAEISQQLQTILSPLLKVWSLMVMLAAAVERAVHDDSWCDTGSPAASVDALLDVFTMEGPLGRLDVWLVLPLLFSLLSRSSLEAKQVSLIALSMSIKSDGSQGEALGAMPSKELMHYFLRLADPSRNPSSVKIRQGSSSHHHQQLDDDWARVERFGDIAQITEGQDMVVTSREIACDILSAVIADKIRYHSLDAWEMWQQFLAALREHYSGDGVEGPASVPLPSPATYFLKRLTALVLQKLNKGVDNWSLEFIHFITQFVTFIEEENMCSHKAYSDIHDSTSVDLLQIESLHLSEKKSEQETYRTEFAVEEKNIFCYLMDFMTSMRKVAMRGTLGGLESTPLLAAFRIMLGCLRRVDGGTGERLASELLALVAYLAEPWGFFGGASAFKEYVILVFDGLRGAIRDRNLSITLRYRYEATVFLLVNFFVHLRNDVVRPGGEGGGGGEGRRQGLPVHVLPTMDAVVVAEGLSDLEAVFRLLDVSMKTADSISFAVDEDFVSVPRPTRMSEVLSKQLAGPGGSGSGSGRHSPNMEIDFLTPPPPATSSPRPPTGSSKNEQTASGKGGQGVSVSQSPTPPLLLDEELSSAASVLLDDLPDLTSSTCFDTYEIISASDIPLSQTLTVPSPPVNQLSPVTSPPAPPLLGIRDHATTEKATKWIHIRKGILQERIDTERSRLSQAMEYLDSSADATSQFWKKCQRKVKSELYLMESKCEWKLGVAHESPFPSRRRVILRPRYEGEGSERQSSSKLGAGAGSHRIDTESLKQVLAQACVGYIKDVREAEAEAVQGEEVSMDTRSGGGGGGAGGGGWGVVDADGSEEGYGVVGTAQDALAEDREGRSYGYDRSSDATSELRVLEESMKQGRQVETGPCHHGTRHITGGSELKSARVFLVTPSGNYKGTLCYNSREIYFMSDRQLEGSQPVDDAAVTLVPARRMRRRRWVLAAVSAVYLRRYRLRDSALEVFLKRGKHRNFFVDFGHTVENAKLRNSFAKGIMDRIPKNAIKQWPGVSSGRLLTRLGLQDRWVSGDLSNYDYLMALNTLGGRSYSDLTQYPIMPWVLSQYTQSKIDLSDPASYRDLSKPMGAINPQRLSDFMARYASYAESQVEVPPFMYGSHYSTMVGVVLHFLVRLQPFAALHQDIQNGHFDVSDRLFSSVPLTWEHNTTMLSEVKELTPEWYTLPDFLRNVNSFDFGLTQDGQVVHDVELPPWAASPEDFIRVQREALESEYVSAHLHEWIDLIFGYKQKGPAAVEASNVFYYLTYYGSVDRGAIKDEELRKAIELQIAHFGQCPIDLFSYPHPPRRGQSVPRPLRRCFDELTVGFVQCSSDEESISALSPGTLLPRLSTCCILAVKVLLGRIVCILENGVLELYRYGISESGRIWINSNSGGSGGGLGVISKLPAASLQQIESIRRKNMKSFTLKTVSTMNSVKKLTAKIDKKKRNSPPIVTEPETETETDTYAVSESDWSTQPIISFDDVAVTPPSRLATPDPSATTTTTMAKAVTSSTPVLPDGTIPPPLLVPTGSTGSGAGAGATLGCALEESVVLVSHKDIAEDMNNNNVSPATTTSPPVTTTTTTTHRTAQEILFDFKEPLLIAEKDTTHFEVVPRVPLAYLTATTTSAGELSARKQSGKKESRLGSSSNNSSSDDIPLLLQSVRLLHYNHNGTLILSCGRMDGAIAVRELDTLSGIVRGAGEFRAHSAPVVALASDIIPGDMTDVIVSCDMEGQVMVWTISRDKTSGARQISRRPQRLFRCFPPPVSCCDISWSMGIVLVGNSRGQLSVYSIERNERMRFIDVAADTRPFFQLVDHDASGSTTSADVVIDNICVSNYGYIACFLEVNVAATECTSANYDDNVNNYSNSKSNNMKEVTEETLYYIAVYSIAGVRTAMLQVPTKVTCMSCPGKEGVLITGHLDGAVRLFDLPLLELLLEYDPLSAYVTCPPPVPGLPPGAGIEAAMRIPPAPQPAHASGVGLTSHCNPPRSAVVSIQVGPEADRPALLLVSTAAGALFMKPLPDYLRWERHRSASSSLSQIVNAPMLAMRGTILQAQAYATDAAGALAVNAKNISDEAFKKINSSKLLKGVGQFFGLG